MSRLTAAQQAELDRLHRETIALIDWFAQHQRLPMWDAVKQLADKARDRQRLGDMRSIAREMRGFLNEMPEELAHLVVAAVEAESGVPLTERVKADVAEAEGLLAEGVVRSQADYDVLRAFVERLASDPGRATEVNKALTILDGYTGSDEAAP